MTPALACVQTDSSAARATCAPGRGSAHGRAWICRADRPVEQPVPARVQLDLVDPLPEAIVGQQPRLVAFRPARMRLRLGGGGDDAGLANTVQRPAGAFALEPFAERGVAGQEVDVFERNGLVHGEILR